MNESIKFLNWVFSNGFDFKMGIDDECYFYNCGSDELLTSLELYERFIKEEL